MRAFFLILFFLPLVALSQKISNVDYDEVKLTTADSSSAFYYAKLQERMIALDTTLSEKEYFYLYYGNVFQSNYSPYGDSDAIKNFNDLYKEAKFTEAIVAGEKVLKENPVNIRVQMRMLVCYHKLGDKVMAKKYAHNYYSLLNVIYSSGEGTSLENPFVVIRVSDEYDIISDLECRFVKQALVGTVDVMTVIPPAQGDGEGEDVKGKKKKSKKGKEETRELYFDVTQSFSYLQRQFRESDKK